MKINSTTQSTVQSIRDQQAAATKAKETATKTAEEAKETPKVQGPTGNNLDLEA